LLAVFFSASIRNYRQNQPLNSPLFGEDTASGFDAPETIFPNDGKKQRIYSVVLGDVVQTAIVFK